MKAQRGFTLVEILIVVVILGILAAIVIPQFTEASTEARESSLVSNLQALRAQIELYKSQHYDVGPGQDSDPNTFENQMVYTSDKDGLVSVPLSRVRTTAFPCGPYMERVAENPFADETDPLVRFTAATDGTDSCTGAAHWVYNNTTGEIYPDDDWDKAKDGTPDHLGY